MIIFMVVIVVIMTIVVVVALFVGVVVFVMIAMNAVTMAVITMVMSVMIVGFDLGVVRLFVDVDRESNDNFFHVGHECLGQGLALQGELRRLTVRRLDRLEIVLRRVPHHHEIDPYGIFSSSDWRL